MSKRAFQEMMDDLETLFKLAKHSQKLSFQPDEYKKNIASHGAANFHDVYVELREMESILQSIKDIPGSGSEEPEYLAEGLEKLAEMQKDCQMHIDKYKKDLAAASLKSEETQPPTRSAEVSDEDPEKLKKRIKERKKKFRRLGNKKGWIPLK